ncbi:MAG TPA: AsmA-like C-terminal region-containing protein [Acetobacteraceae bacterium]|nr:AsmA-like C-terminal region-containing protein [Acetobacteraceae bacterium]
MRSLSGQAARHTGRLLHAILTLALLLVLLAGAGGGFLAWRLAQGPMEVTWLARRLEQAANAGGGPTRLHIGSAALAWEGFRRGVDMPLEVRLASITAVDAAGVQIADVPRAEVSLSIGELLLGRLRPRAIELDGARLRLLRAVDGTMSLDLGSLTEAEDSGAPPKSTPGGPSPWPGFLTELARPAGSDRTAERASFIGQLRRVRVSASSLVVEDRQLGATWRAPMIDLDLERLTRGGIEGSGEARLALGDQRATLHLIASLAPGGGKTQLRASVDELHPAALARTAPALAPLSALEAPVAITLGVELGPHLALRDVVLDAKVGAGQAHLGDAVVPLESAALTAEGNADQLTLHSLQVALHGHAGAPMSHLQASGQVLRTGGRLRTSLTLTLDQVAFADLRVLWPEGVGGNARDWVTQNITAGTARDARVEAQLDSAEDFSDVVLAGATGTLAGDGLTVHWLRPIPPIERARATLRIVDPDTLEITAQGGQQHSDVARGDPLTIRGGRIRITGIEHPDQVGAIEAQIDGGVAETLALLRNPRLQLLDKHPFPVRDPAGHASVKLSVQLPLEDKVKIDDIAVRAQAHLENVHLGDIAAGRSLDQGQLDLDASNDGLKVSGEALLAGIDADLDAEMDFRAGPPAQVMQKVTVSGRASAQQIAAAGLDAGPLLSGTADLNAVLTERRDGRGVLQADADLTRAALTAAPIDWKKPVGSPANLAARLVLDHGRLTGIDALTLEGKDVSVRGRAEYGGGQVTALRFDRLVLGRTQAQGTVRFPPAGGNGGPIQASFQGAVIDLSAVTQHKSQPAAAKQPAKTGPSWTLDARFDQAMMAGGRTFTGIAARADNDGLLFTRLLVDGRTGPSAPFHLEIVPERGGRRITGTAADAGALFSGLDLIGTMSGGHLSLSGTYDDRRADHPLSGTAEITDFRVRDPNGLGRLLQAMTLYGLVQAASGPGLGFTRLTAPFRLTDDALDLGESRAFSPSLGLTAKGHIDLRRNIADLQGTIVPAYFFNSLLGNVPIIGKLFSPESGGGVFAASYTVRGPLDDPQVSVNPLSALTPGFLRGLFGLF